MLRNSRNRYLQSYELMPLLGYEPGGHLPPEGFPPRRVDGVAFRCDPAATQTPSSRRHRIHYLCEWCNLWIPFGRAGQHNKGRAHYANANPPIAIDDWGRVCP